MSRTSFFVVVLLTASAVFLGRMGLRSAAEFARTEFSHQAPGRVQLVLDEQDVGIVRSGTELAVKFAVANAGLGELRIRQASETPQANEEAYGAVTIEPGQTGEVIAMLISDDLLERGRKHVRFRTTDPALPELWLTVSGNVVRPAANR